MFYDFHIKCIHETATRLTQSAIYRGYLKHLLCMYNFDLTGERVYTYEKGFEIIMRLLVTDFDHPEMTLYS